MFHQLSKQYEDLYQQHLESFQRRLARTFPISSKYTDFYPSIGVPADQPVEFLVYGQAVGGWQPEHDHSQPVPSDRVEISKDWSNGRIESDSPLDWVNVQWSKYGPERWSGQRSMYIKNFGDYTPSRSFFWNVITRLITTRCQLHDLDWDWTTKLVWSNLYKIAPQDGDWKPNPSDADCVLQRPEAVWLVKKELEELKPKYCIVITNDEWWAHFRKGIGTKVLETLKDSFVQSVEQFGTSRIVVTKRPFVGSAKAAVEEISKYLPTPEKEVVR